MTPSCPHPIEVRPGEYECRLSGISISPDCGRSRDEWGEGCIPVKALAWLAGTLNIGTITDPREVDAIMNTATTIQQRAAAGTQAEKAEAAEAESKKGAAGLRLEGLSEAQLDTLIARAREIKRRASGGRKMLDRIQAYRHALEREVAEKAQLIDLLIQAIAAIEAGRIPPKLPKIPRVLTPEEREKISERMKAMRAKKLGPKPAAPKQKAAA